MKYFLTSFFVLTFIPLVAFATTPAPQSVFYLPTNADKGDNITLNAFVYNGTNKSATVTVVFSADTLDVGEATVALSALSGKAATLPWKFPESTTVVTATVTKASDANQKSIPELLGVVGTATLGEAETGLTGTNVENKLKGILGSVFGSIDPWRAKQATYFATLRDKKKVELGIKTAKDVYDALKPAPAAPGQEQTLSDLPPGATVNLGSYVVLIYATAFASIFSSIALFYITLILLVLFLIRFIIRIFR